MFSNFGVPTTSFGSSPINASTNSSFGAPSTSFNQPSTSFFGSQQKTSPFASPFGQSSNNGPAFSNSLFGNSQGQPTGNLFGNVKASIFSQQNTNNTPSQMETMTNQNIGLFGNVTGLSTNTLNNKLGTPIKFSPIKDNESLLRAGISHNLIVTFQSITCMKEYENKSFEELRLEDYQMNRKDQQQGFFGNAPSSNAPSFFNNAATTTTNLTFPQPEKSIFGNTTFGQTNSNFGTTPTPSGVFNKPDSLGLNSMTFSSSLNPTTQANNVFGSNTANNTQFAFPVQPSTSVGQPPIFGAQLNFGSNQTAATNQTTFFNQNNLLNKNKTTPFSLAPSPATNAFGLFGQQIAPISTPTTVTPSLFGQTNQGKFLNISNNNISTPLFGSRQKPNSNVGSGFTIPVPGGISTFGNTTNKPNILFNNTIGSGNSFNSSGLANTSSFNLQGTGPQIIANQNSAQIDTHQHIISMSSSPYGDTNLFNNVSTFGDLQQYARITSPQELNAVMKTIHKSSPVLSKDKIKPIHIINRQDAVFSGLEYYDKQLVLNTQINSNPKRLIVRYDPKLMNNSLESDSLTNNSITTIETENLENVNANLDLLTDSENINDMQPNIEFIECNNNIEPIPHITNNLLAPSSTLSEVQSFNDNLNNNSESKEDENKDLCIENKNLDNCQTDCTNSTETNTSYSDKSDTSVQHATGIILTRPEYYTVPSLNELDNYVNKDGSCLVKGFTVGRFGYGNIYFPETFDVSNLNLDELVHFRHKEIAVYPDSTTKPIIGQGLNRKCQVTLDRVWPMDKRSKMFITDVNILIEMNYSEKLVKLCAKQGSRFIDYRPDTGSWVFKVNHF